MRYSLKQFESIPDDAQSRLTAIGIMDTETLLQQAATPLLRQKLHKKTNIEEDVLARWAGMADLVRINGLGATYAELLVQSEGVLSVKHLLETLRIEPLTSNESDEDKSEHKHMAAGIKSLVMTVKNTTIAKWLLDKLGFAAEESEEEANDTTRDSIDTVIKTLRSYATEANYKGKIPGKQILMDVGQAALELRPRLAIDIGTIATFDEDVDVEAKKGSKLQRKMTLIIMGILVITMIMLVTKSWMIAINIRNEDVAATTNIVAAISTEIAWIANQGVFWSMIIPAMTILVVGLIIFSTLELITYVNNIWLPRLLFDSPRYRQHHLDISKRQRKHLQRSMRWVMALFAIAMLGTVVYTVLNFDLFLELSSQEMVNRYLTPSVFIVVLAALAFGLPYTYFYLQVLHKDSTLDDEFIQRFLVAELLGIIQGVVMLIVAMQVLLGGVALPNHMIETYLVPQVRENILAQEQLLLNLDIDDNQSLINQRDYLLRRIDREYLGELDTILVYELGEIEELINHLMSSIVWALIVLVVLTFVIPYLAFMGWRKGSFYAMILSTGFLLENQLQVAAPNLFSLQAESSATWGVIIFVVFANALFFDWIFETFAQTKKSCPNCHTRLDNNATYCSCCSLQQ